jgi:hypothetical protein
MANKAWRGPKMHAGSKMAAGLKSLKKRACLGTLGPFHAVHFNFECSRPKAACNCQGSLPAPRPGLEKSRKRV